MLIILILNQRINSIIRVSWSKRRWSFQHDKEDNSCCKNINLCSNVILLNNLRCFIPLWTKISMQDSWLVFSFQNGRKAKVSNLQNIILNEYIFRFKVTVSDSVFNQLSKTIQDLEQTLESSFLVQASVHTQHRS